MNSDASIEPPQKAISIKVFGVGNTGLKVLECLAGAGLPNSSLVSLDTEAHSLAASPAAEKLHLETKPLRGLGTGGDPDRGRAVAEEHLARLKELCAGVDAVFIIAGLGGGAGTGIAPVLARAAKETGALVLGFVTTPFDCEMSRRQRLAAIGLQELRAAADGVICLPNQKVCRLIDENTSALDTFKITNQLLAEGVQGVWRLLRRKGIIEIHFADLAGLFRDRHVESFFAVAEAMGPLRSREVMDKLLAHPMLDGGQMLAQADAVLVSLIGGPDLAMAEINRVMEQLGRQCEHAQVMMGAAIDPALRDRLAVTLIATRKNLEAAPSEGCTAREAEHEELGAQLLEHSAAPRPGSRFLPPAPPLPPEKVALLLARQARPGTRSGKGPPKFRQTHLPLEIISKGRFDKSEPTIYKGEDLDVPTYIRRGIALN